MQRITGLGKGSRSAVRRIVVLLLITWVPMCLFAIVQGIALGDTPRESFLLDFATYARFFVGIPALVFAEDLIGGRLRRAGLLFVHDGLVKRRTIPPSNVPLHASRKGVSPCWQCSSSSPSPCSAPGTSPMKAPAGWLVGWQSVDTSGGARLPVTPLPRSGTTSLPCRCFCSCGIAGCGGSCSGHSSCETSRSWTCGWFRRMPTPRGGWAFSKLPTRPSESSRLPWAASSARRLPFKSSTRAPASRHSRHQSSSRSLAIQLLFLGPLLVFSPTMARVRRAALKSYGSLAVRYGRGFQEKWIDSPPPPDEQLLGSSDIQSLTDMGASFRFVDEMGLTPFGRRAVIQLAVATLLPGLPLLLLVVPIEEIIDALAKIVI